MALTFYHGAGSPYGWRVWLALEYKGIDYDLRVLSFSQGDLKQPEYAAINPRQRVPAIVDDGLSLYESAAILEYLEERHVELPALFPGDIGQRALIRRMVCEADHYMAPALESLVEHILHTDPGQRNRSAIVAAGDTFARELSIWETMGPRDGLAGEWSAADFTLYPLIALALRIERREPDLAIRARIGPQTAAWMARFETLPFFARTWPAHWT